jgi:hypothetical protein
LPVQGRVRRPRRGTLQRLAVALGLEHDTRAQFIEAAEHSAASSFSAELSTVDPLAKSHVSACLAELLEQIPIQHPAGVLVVQLIGCGHAHPGCRRRRGVGSAQDLPSLDRKDHAHGTSGIPAEKIPAAMVD